MFILFISMKYPNLVTPSSIQILDEKILSAYVYGVSDLIQSISKRNGQVNNIKVPISSVRENVRQHNVITPQDDQKYIDYIVGNDSPFREIGWTVRYETGCQAYERDTLSYSYLLFSY
jgi:hypothetical protein